VTYRVAGGLVFLVVTAPTANVFSCLELANSVVRVVAALPTDGKGADITPERLHRRFSEVGGGGGVQTQTHFCTGLPQGRGPEGWAGRRRGGWVGPVSSPGAQRQAAGDLDGGSGR
jgi:hypothetical protein